MFFFFFNDTATTEIYTLSLHDALPISKVLGRVHHALRQPPSCPVRLDHVAPRAQALDGSDHHIRLARPKADRHPRRRSEEHTSELQSRQYLVCRLLLEKKKKNNITSTY